MASPEQVSAALARAHAANVSEFPGDRPMNGHEPPPHDRIPERADGEPDHGPSNGTTRAPATDAPAEESDCLEEWDAGEDTESPPPREWLLGNQFCRKFVSGLTAPGATGKSATRLVQYMALATGRDLVGQHVFKRTSVLVISMEDDRDELRRRIRAACLHHDVEPGDLKGWLYCWTPKGIKLATMKDGAMQKGQQTAGDADAGRGASATRDAGRLFYTLTRMTEDEAKQFGIAAEQRALYVRLDSSKVNIAPPSDKATWFKLVGVHLGNATADYPAGDDVQTVERWHPPETWEGVTSAQANAALDQIEAGLPNGQRYSDAGPATSRAAWRAVEHHCPDRTEAQCREIVRTWVKNGVLVNEDYDDPIERKARKGLRVCNEKRPT